LTGRTALMPSKPQDTGLRSSNIGLQIGVQISSFEVAPSSASS
jgi:hypothetical protein